MKINKVDSVTKNIAKTAKKTTKEVAVPKAVKKLEPKNYPNWLGLPGENYGGRTVLCKVTFYPEDIKKMESMTKEEASAYQDRLYFEHRYIEEENPRIHYSEHYINYLKEHNINMEDFEVRK